MIKAILFDLDGTLLPMQMDAFIKTYMKAIAEKMAKLGLEPQKLIDVIWKGTAAMVKNDGSRTNEECFWAVYEEQMGREFLQYKPEFDAFYSNEFEQAKVATNPTPEAAALVQWLQEETNVKLVVATNPVFPEAAQKSRIGWAGLNPDAFAHITSYENSGHCKPNPAYYQAILNEIGVQPEEAVMIGNDAAEDTAAAQLGMPVFLVTDCLWNEHQRDISAYPQGSFADLKAYLQQLFAERGVAAK